MGFGPAIKQTKEPEGTALQMNLKEDLLILLQVSPGAR